MNLHQNKEKVGYKENSITDLALPNAYLEIEGLLSKAVAAEVDFTTFERMLVECLRAFGCTMCRRFLNSKEPVAQSTAEDSDKIRHDYAGQHNTTVRTTFGVIEIRTATYVRRRSKKEMSKLKPLLHLVGLLAWGGGFSTNVVLETVELATRMPYMHVREVLSAFRGYSPSTRSIGGLIDNLGPMASDALTQVEIPPCDVILVFADARGLPIIGPQEYKKRCQPHVKVGRAHNVMRIQKKRSSKPRRTPGQKARKIQRVTVGLVIALRQIDGKGWAVVGKKVVANRGGAEPVFQHLSKNIKAMDNESREVYFLSDGDPHLERLQAKYFPQAKSIVDIYHVSEYLWAGAKAVHKKDQSSCLRFVKELKSLLLKDRPDEVLTRLAKARTLIPKTGPGTKERRKTMDNVIRYLTNRKPRLVYSDNLERGLEIGSGAIESAIRQVVAIRFDGPGMRWGDRAQSLLNLLCLRLSGGWPILRKALEAHSKLSLPERRITRPGVNEKSGAQRRKARRSRLAHEAEAA